VEIEVKLIDIKEYKCGAVVTGCFEDTGFEAKTVDLDDAMNGALSELYKQDEIKGKVGEITVVHCLGKILAERVVVAGLGKREELTSDKIRRVIADVCRLLRQKNIADIAVSVLGNGIAGIKAENSAQSLTEGILLGTYTFRKHITRDAEYKELQSITIITDNENELVALNTGCEIGKSISEAANLARDMVNEPANFMTPTDMANMATGLAEKYALEIQVLDKEKMIELGMGGLLGVSQGSNQPPKLIVLNYKGRGVSEVDITIVGKGITFDSGGISIKPSEKMEEMKGDMAGGAAVMGAMSAIARLKPEINVRAMIPATENLPNGSALKPGDVLTASNGKTIEIISTDAEGRLILADALSYANKLGTKYMVDVATLTGACRVALGDICTGVFGNNQELTDKIIVAGNETGECMWQMPMNEEYKELNKSDIADIKNVGGRYAGAITAAQFLSEFAGDTPWIHLDIAGPFLSSKEKGYQVKGATGVPVRTLINLVMALAIKQVD